MEISFETRERLDRARRENAHRSTGPTSEQGKAVSSQNARKHGFSGANIVVADEDKAAFAAHLDSYFASFEPANQAESDQVRRIAFSQWRYDRLLAVETGLLDLALGQPDLDNRHLLAAAFADLTNSPDPLNLCQRYLNQAGREIDRAIRAFHLLKQNRPEPKPQQNQPKRNEPTVAPAPRLPKPPAVLTWTSHKPDADENPEIPRQS